MTERRHEDRRQQDAPVETERRHGERRTYRTGCRCTPCKAANAAYEAYRVTQHRHGKLLLGSRMSAVETWRRVRQLKAEHLSQAEIAGRLGLPRRRLEFSHARVTVRTYLRLKRLCRQLLGDDAEARPARPD